MGTHSTCMSTHTLHLPICCQWVCYHAANILCLVAERSRDPGASSNTHASMCVAVCVAVCCSVCCSNMHASILLEIRVTHTPPEHSHLSLFLSGMTGASGIMVARMPPLAFSSASGLWNAWPHARSGFPSTLQLFSLFSQNRISFFVGLPIPTGNFITGLDGWSLDG